MSTIIATPDVETGSVTLVIEKTATIDKVVRTNVNGTEEVRVAEGQLPSALQSEFRTNYATNPTFANNGAGWTLTEDFPTFTSVAFPTTGGYSGGAFMRYSRDVDSPSSYHVALSGNVVNASAGTNLTISWYVRGTASADFHNYTQLDVINYTGLNGTGNQSSSNGLLITKSQSGSWLRYSKTYTVPAGIQSVGFGFLVYQSAATMAQTVPAGSTVDVSSVMVEKADAAGAYFDGSSAGATWTGTAHASISTIGSGGTVILSDYEAAHGANTYNAYHPDGSFVTATATLELDKPWLSVPVMPQYSEQVETVTQFNAGREAATTVHRPLGRADALVVMGKLGTRTGTLEIFCHSYAEARKLERVFERGEIVHLRQRVEGLDMYFTVTSIPVSPYSIQGEAETRWSMTINYVEVRRPIGSLAGALGWTFDALAVEFPSFDTVSAAFVDFDALTLGDGIV